MFGLLECDWGKTVALQSDTDLCPGRAVQDVMLHGLAGQHIVRLCEKHYAVILRETDPHQERED